MEAQLSRHPLSQKSKIFASSPKGGAKGAVREFTDRKENFNDYHTFYPKK